MISIYIETSWLLNGEWTREGAQVKQKMSKLILTISYVFLPSLRSDMSILVTYPSERHTYSSKSLAIGSRFAKLSFYLRAFGNHSNTAYKVLVLCASL